MKAPTGRPRQARFGSLVSGSSDDEDGNSPQREIGVPSSLTTPARPPRPSFGQDAPDVPMNDTRLAARSRAWQPGARGS